MSLRTQANSGGDAQVGNRSMRDRWSMHPPQRRSHIPLYISGCAFVLLSFLLFVLVCLAATFADPDSDTGVYGFYALLAVMPCGIGLPLLFAGVMEHASNRSRSAARTAQVG